MKKVALWLIAVTVLIPLLLVATFSLWGPSYSTALLKPAHAFEEDSITVPPDYNSERYWASLPNNSGLGNLTPNHQIPREGSADTAVFYIHPTSYLSNKRWNAPLFADSWAWEMVDNMMATQASAFNACCDVYAPHYREATLWSFIERETQDGQHALEFAYEDVLAAFDVFLSHYVNDRPFIIASHSQGTVHALRLLSERVNDSYLREKLVAAYLIGYELPLDYFDRELTAIPPCESATDTTCIIHWATYGEGVSPKPSAKHHYSDGWEEATHKKILCTNPLSWRIDEERAESTLHNGALAIEGGYSLFNIALNRPTGNTLDLLPAVKPQWTWAQCKEGFLLVEPQLDGPFHSDLDDEERNYHTRDYSLFYQNISDNAVLRAAHFSRRTQSTAISH